MTAPWPLFASTTRTLEEAMVLDRPADMLSGVVDVVLPTPLRRVLHGTWLGHPVHPFMVTVPIGCWTSASLLDVSGRDRHAAQQLIGVGIMGAVGALATGWADWRTTTGAARRVGVVHATVNAVALGIYVGSWRLRVGGRHRTGALIALGGAAVMATGGYLGGHMSYALGANVADPEEQEHPDPDGPVMTDGADPFPGFETRMAL